MPALELRGLAEALEAVDDEVARRAARRTINELTKKGKTRQVKSITERYNISSRVLGAAMEVKTLAIASGAGKASIKTTGQSSLPLAAVLKESQVKTGVALQVRRDRPRKIIKHAWIQKGLTVETFTGGGIDPEDPDAHTGIFSRKWRLGNNDPSAPKRPAGAYARMKKVFRLPMKPRWTLGIVSMTDQDGTYEAIQELVDTESDTIYQRNYQYYADKEGP